MPESRTWRSVVDVGCLAIFAASMAGGICGTAMITAWVFFQSPEGFSLLNLVKVPVVGIFYGFVLSPIVGFGLVLFGIPLTKLIGDRLTRRSGWLLVPVSSGISGVVFLTILSALFGPIIINEEWLTTSAAISLPYSLPAGLVWWAFIRRDLRIE